MTELARLDSLVREPVWVTRDGRPYRITEMTDSHLFNTIRMLCGQSPIGTVFRTTNRLRWMWVLVITREAHRRGWTQHGVALLEPVLIEEGDDA